MNLTNKLLFPLLLIATLFTSACFDDTPAPKSGKEPCVAASECESNQCVQGLCVPAPKKLNDPCVTTSECKSPLICLADKCANKPGDGSVADDGACTEDKECQAPGSTCKNDVCTAPAAHSVADKGACSDTVQCQYGSTCDTATNTCLAPLDGSVAIGAMCAEDKQCKSNKCDTTTSHTCQKPLDLHKPCSNSTPSCGAPLVCLGVLCEYAPGDHTVGDGGDCTDTKQCQGASECSKTSYTCEPPAAPVTKVKKGQSCKATSECDTDLVCLGKMGAQTCQDKPNDGSLKEGAFCSDDKQCETGLACKQATAGGDMVCVKATLAGLGKACSKPSDCASNTCDNSICVPKDNSVDPGGQCSKTTQCIQYPSLAPSFVCVKSTTSGDPSLCLPTCNIDSDCLDTTNLKCAEMENTEGTKQKTCAPR